MWRFGDFYLYVEDIHINRCAMALRTMWKRKSGRGAPSDRARTLAGSRSNNPSVSATRLGGSVTPDNSDDNSRSHRAVEAPHNPGTEGAGATEIESAVRQAFKDLGLPERKVVTAPVLYGRGEGLVRSGAATTERRRVGGYSYQSVAYVSLSGTDPTSTAYHEGFHVLEQMGLFADQEIAVMERDRARLLPLAAQALGGTCDPANLSPRELRTYAFEQYRRDRDVERFTPGLIPGIRRTFGRLRDLLHRLRGVVEGIGIVDASKALGAEEVFRRAESGQVGMRRYGGCNTPGPWSRIRHAVHRDL
jgi:hypothetical protein